MCRKFDCVRKCFCSVHCLKTLFQETLEQCCLAYFFPLCGQFRSFCCLMSSEKIFSDECGSDINNCSDVSFCCKSLWFTWASKTLQYEPAEYNSCAVQRNYKRLFTKIFLMTLINYKVGIKNWKFISCLFHFQFLATYNESKRFSHRGG